MISMSGHFSESNLTRQSSHRRNHVRNNGPSIENSSIQTTSSRDIIIIIISVPHPAMQMVVSVVDHGVDLDVPDAHNLTQISSQPTRSKLNLFSF